MLNEMMEPRMERSLRSWMGGRRWVSRLVCPSAEEEAEVEASEAVVDDGFSLPMQREWKEDGARI